jgi:HupE / UreJ protein
MQSFLFYFPLGWEHIISVDALDHQLFILALAALYAWQDWKQVLILVTAFTVGHSLTLALSVLNVLSLNSEWVEFLIPLTIVLTATSNLLQRHQTTRTLQFNYWLALFFGFIHGMGFANSIRFMLSEEQQLGGGLLGFNLGLEAGQLVFVALLLGLTYLILDVIKLSRKKWTMGLSLIALASSLFMTANRIPF